MAHFEHRTAYALILTLACMPAAAPGAAFAADAAAPAAQAAAEETFVADGPPVFLAVIGVRSDDVLHLRDVPSADSKSLADIPPNTRGLKKIGCMRVQLSMDRYMYMSKEERVYAQAPWCRVEYKGLQGWVSARYVKEEAPTKQ